MKVLVVGAGISGCICARRLSDLGHEVTVVDTHIIATGNKDGISDQQGCRCVYGCINWRAKTLEEKLPTSLNLQSKKTVTDEKEGAGNLTDGSRNRRGIIVSVIGCLP